MEHLSNHYIFSCQIGDEAAVVRTFIVHLSCLGEGDKGGEIMLRATLLIIIIEKTCQLLPMTAMPTLINITLSTPYA